MRRSSMHFSRAVSPLSTRFSSIPLSRIRNYAIIAHVDHGKSSLASRILELTKPLTDSTKEIDDLAGNKGIEFFKDVSCTNTAYDLSVSAREDIALLDTLQVEQERGITVKSTTASVLHRHPETSLPYLLNFIDTPGHVDFSREVTRTLRHVNGALLLFDAVQGVQAQSLAVYQKAQEKGVTCVPVITKCDMTDAREVEIAIAISELFGFDPDEVILTSARKNEGIGDVLDAVVERVRCPDDCSIVTDEGEELTAINVVDSWYEIGRGVVCLIKMLSGAVKEGDKILLESRPDQFYSVQEIGVLLPGRHRTKSLIKNQFGYAIVGMKNPRDAKSDSKFVLQRESSKWSKLKSTVSSITEPSVISSPPGEDGSVLYANVHPTEAGKFEELCAAVEKLALNDTGLEVTKQKGPGDGGGGGEGGDNSTLGPGLKIGFQGLLHVEIFRQRLLDEFHVDALVTNPKVKYTVEYLPNKKRPRNKDLPTVIEIEDLAEWPEAGSNFIVKEPMVNLSVMAPHEYAGKIMELLSSRRATEMETLPIDDRTWLFKCRIPWAEVVSDFHDSLKNITAGFASFDLVPAGIEKANLQKVDISLNGDVINVLSFIAHCDIAQGRGRIVCEKLQDTIPRQQFPIAVQARIGNKVIARTTVKPYRKDVLTKGSKTVGGGDVTRKKKLLEKQKAGKKRMAAGGSNSNRVQLSQEAFTSVIAR